MISQSKKDSFSSFHKRLEWVFFTTYANYCC